MTRSQYSAVLRLAQAIHTVNAGLKLAKSTLARDKQDIARILPHLGHYKLADLRPEHFRKFYADMRKVKNQSTGKPLSESTIEGLHSYQCGILSNTMEDGFLDHNPAWRTASETLQQGLEI